MLPFRSHSAHAHDEGLAMQVVVVSASVMLLFVHISADTSEACVTQSGIYHSM